MAQQLFDGPFADGILAIGLSLGYHRDMLPGWRIRDLARQGELLWTGDIVANFLLVRLGSPLQRLRRSPRPVDLTTPSDLCLPYGPPDTTWHDAVLAHGDLVLVQAKEELHLPLYVAGMLGGLSHVARAGLATLLDSIHTRPGWRGRLTLELHNIAPTPLRLRTGMPVAKTVLFRLQGCELLDDSPQLYGDDGALMSRYCEAFPDGL